MKTVQEIIDTINSRIREYEIPAKIKWIVGGTRFAVVVNVPGENNQTIGVSHNCESLYIVGSPLGETHQFTLPVDFEYIKSLEWNCKDGVLILDFIYQSPERYRFYTIGPTTSAVDGPFNV